MQQESFPVSQKLSAYVCVDCLLLYSFQSSSPTDKQLPIINPQGSRKEPCCLSFLNKMFIPHTPTIYMRVNLPIRIFCFTESIIKIITEKCRWWTWYDMQQMQTQFLFWLFKVWFTVFYFEQYDIRSFSCCSSCGNECQEKLFFP